MSQTYPKVLSIEDVARRLAAHRRQLEEMKVRKLYLFGSMARGEASEESDIDLLLKHEPSLGLFELVGIGHYLEDILGRPVDLGTELKDSVRDAVQRDLVDVF
ncbi:MAG: nucleotidyltransferase domain-containing protein [Cyanobacteria bacterium P01_C01_bin.89]